MAESGLGGQSWEMACPQAEDSHPNPRSLSRCWDTIHSSLWWIIKGPILISILVSPPLAMEPRVGSQPQSMEEVREEVSA